MTRNSYPEKACVPSEARVNKQNEALSKNAATMRCIRELQEMTLAETGRESRSVEEAYEGSCLAAVGLVSEKVGDDLPAARDVLREFGYPDLVD